MEIDLQRSGVEAAHGVPVGGYLLAHVAGRPYSDGAAVQQRVECPDFCAGDTSGKNCSLNSIILLNAESAEDAEILIKSPK